jgi:hypothetical protein
VCTTGCLPLGLAPFVAVAATKIFNWGGTVRSASRRVLARPLAVAVLAVANVAGLRAEHRMPPADPCTWLTTTQLEKVLGGHFTGPVQGSFPPAFAGQEPGTKCDFAGGTVTVTLIAYLDPSAAAAKGTFDQLSTMFGPEARPGGIGDDAYIDAQRAIHVRKGSIRYYVSLSPASTPGHDARVGDLAKAIASAL